MTIDLATWLGETGDLAGNPSSTEESRAAAAWRRIQDKPTSVTFRQPDGTDLAAQTVRLEYDDSVSESESPAGQGAVRKLVIFGIRNHATLADTDVAEGYRFNYLDDAYRVVDVIYTIGEVQAICEAVG